MEKNYYIASGDKVQDLIAETKKLLDFRDVARKKLLHDYEADFLLTENTIFYDEKVVGLGFKEPVKRSFLLKSYQFCKEGFAYRPDARTLKGQVLKRRLREDSALHFSASKHIISRLRVDRIVLVGHDVERSAAVCLDDSILVYIPGGEETGKRSDPFPAIQEFFKKITETDWERMKRNGYMLDDEEQDDAGMSDGEFFNALRTMASNGCRSEESIYYALVDLISEHLMDGKGIFLPLLGTLKPVVVDGKPAVTFIPRKRLAGLVETACSRGKLPR